MTDKICNGCKTERPESCFNKRSASKDGLNHKCRDCVSKAKKYYRDKNVEKAKESERKIRSRNKEKINLKQKKSYLAEPEKQYARRRKYRENNAEKIRKRNKSYYHRVIKNDPKWKARRAVYRHLRRVLNYSGAKKVRRSEHILGYGPEKLKQRMEVNFAPGMGWDNYGYEWQIDHVKPISAFIAEGEKRPEVISMLCNLRPMWASENAAKGGKWDRIGG